MKKNKLLFILLFLPFSAFCQSLTGLWNGSFSNDSTTLRSDQPFEIALTEYKGKVYGYSRREFIKNDTLYFVLKRVKGRITGDSCEVTEDEFISHNLPVIDKGVKITYTFHFNEHDSSWTLDGRWKTNRVVKRKYEYYSLTGKVGMSIQKDLSKSKLFPHLAELKLDEDVPFYAAHKKQEALQRDLAEAEVRRKNDLAKAEQKKKTEAPVLKPDTTKDIAKTNTNKEKQKEAPPATPKEVATTPAPKEKPKDLSPTKTTEPQVTAKDVAVTKPEEKKKEENAVRKESAPAVKDIAVGNPALKNEPPAKPVAAVNVEKRRSETIQTVEFKSDSLLLSLYDNGEVDGDTVSVLINGEVIMPQQGLKATAIKKTIYITPALKDSFNMVLYAENLGKYPPNTGLIIVHDGDDTYQVRFSADLQKNVEVLFRRKKN